MSLTEKTDMKNAPGNPKAKAIVIEWIDHILDRKKWSGTDLARHSELAPSTILRLLNNPKHPFVPTVATLQKIANGSGYPIPKKVMAALGAADQGDGGNSADVEPENIRQVNARTRQATVELRHISSLPASSSGARWRRRRTTPAISDNQMTEKTRSLRPR